ncbi:hypothetical protein RB195_004010 [Necator americanus]
MFKRRPLRVCLTSGLFLVILATISFAATIFHPLFPAETFFSWLQIERNPKNLLPLIIVITPTYKRPTRFADLTRMSYTLRMVPHLHWILVEDANETVSYVWKILERSEVPFTYLAAETVKGYPRRGWYQRNTALWYLRNESEHLMEKYHDGVVYFADDDNSYDIRVFTDYIRNVKRLGMWAVALSGGRPVEYPVVRNGTVIDFEAWLPSRRFAVDMAGFAVNLKEILNSTVVFGKTCKEGMGSPETCFLSNLGFNRSDIEPFGWDTEEEEQEILVWHTKTVNMKFNETLYPNLSYAFEFGKK